MSRNIRYTAWSRPHRKMWGMPVVKTGDWMAMRDGRSVYTKTLWDAGPYAYIPQMASDEGVGTVVPTIEDVTSAVTTTVPQVAAQAVDQLPQTVASTANAVVETASAVATTTLDIIKRYWPAVIVSGIIGFGFGRRG